MITYDDLTPEQQAWLSDMRPGDGNVSLTPINQDAPKKVYALPLSTNPYPWILFEDRTTAYVDEVKEFPG